MADVECLEIHVCKVCGKEHPEPPNKVQFPSRASASCWKCWHPPFHHASIGIVGRLFAQDGQYSPIDGSLGPVLWRWGRGLSAGRSIYIPIYNYLYIYIHPPRDLTNTWKGEQKAASGLIDSLAFGRSEPPFWDAPTSWNHAVVFRWLKTWLGHFVAAACVYSATYSVYQSL